MNRFSGYLMALLAVVGIAGCGGGGGGSSSTPPASTGTGASTGSGTGASTGTGTGASTGGGSVTGLITCSASPVAAGGTSLPPFDCSYTTSSTGASTSTNTDITTSPSANGTGAAGTASWPGSTITVSGTYGHPGCTVTMAAVTACPTGNLVGICKSSTSNSVTSDITISAVYWYSGQYTAAQAKTGCLNSVYTTTYMTTNTTATWYTTP